MGNIQKSLDHLNGLYFNFQVFLISLTMLKIIQMEKRIERDDEN